jgi:ABC-2 type transport system ATP-binding protein
MSPNLEIRALRAGYGARVVIEAVTLAVAAGEWCVLLGPNGCGKTTLLDCVSGRLRPSDGEVWIAGVPLLTNPCPAKRRLGYGCAPEELPPLLTPGQCLAIHAAAKGLAGVGSDVLQLAEELRFTPYLNSFIDTLSLGTRQKLAVLLSLIGDPRLIVLDEAFNGLDPASALVLKRHLRARLRESGASLLLATHALDIVERHADRAALLLDGTLRREWDRSEIGSCAADGGFEAALAATLST